MLANIIKNAKKTVGGGGGGIVTSDPYFSSVSLLLHMDGTNASTNFVDSGPNALAVTAVGNAQISTTQSKYGGASAYFDGAGDAVQIPFNAALDLTSGDFTIEGWVYFNAVSGTPTIITPFGTGTTFGGWVIVLDSSSRLTFYLSTAANTWNLATNVLFSATAVVTGTWYHFALVRNGSAFTPYLNGIAGTTFTSSSTLYNNSRPLKIGAEKDSNSFPLNGYIDDLRVTKYARYTSSFTPPTQAHPNIYNPYTTLPVSGAALWLDASQQNTIFTDAGTTPVTTSGQSIYQWNDLSGNNRHAVQATSGNRPTWVPPASGQNGLGVVGFNGSSSFVEGSWQTFDPLSIYMVFKHTSGTTGSRVFTQSDATNYDTQQVSGSTNWVPLSVVAGPAISSYSTIDTSIGSVSLTSSTWLRIKHLRNGTSIVNSVTNTTSSTTISAITRAMTKYTLGRVSNFNGGYVGMQVGECVAFNKVLSTSEETSMTSYLQAKWGTP